MLTRAHPLLIASLLTVGAGVSTAAAAAPDKGLKTGWGHLVRVLSYASTGLEAGIPSDSSYARGIALDRQGRFRDAYYAFRAAYSEFRRLAAKRPRNAAQVRGWLVKASEQRGLSSSLRYQKRYWNRRRGYRSYYSYNSYARTAHLKWLAVRAYTGRGPQLLLKVALRFYKETLRLRSSYTSARIYYATLLHEIGRWREARQVFSRVSMPISISYWYETAAYFAAAGRADKAFEYIKRLVSRYSYRKRYFVRSNLFDRLRSDPRFKTLVGSP